MELTKEYFDEQLAGITTRLDGMATKKDLEEAVKPLATKVELAEAVKPLATKADLREGIEELARMVADGFAEAAKQRDIEWLRKELIDVRKVINRMFDQMDKNVEMRVRHGEELLHLQARVKKMEDAFKKFNVLGA